MADTKQSVRSTGILLIEDNYADQEIFKVFLAETEYANARLEIAEKISALEKIEIEFVPTIIILDLSLPDSDGLETLRLVQQKYGATPVIILTGFNDKNMGIQAVALGAEDYLIKGEFTSSSIERSISYAIERFKMRKTLLMTNKKLKSYNERLQQFAFVVSHDLNAPISSLKGLNEVTSPSKKPELSIDANICIEAAILIAVRDVCGLIEIFQPDIKLEILINSVIPPVFETSG